MKRSPLPRSSKRLSRGTPLTSGGSALKRTPIKSGGKLSPGTKGLKRAQLVDRATKPKPPPRDTGPTRAVRHTVKARAGMCCERCSVSVAATGHHVHHRRPRQMGGTSRPDTNLPPNLVLLCPACHDWIERPGRAEARATGWLVTAEKDPATIPLVVAGRGLVYLTVHGTYLPAEAAA